MFEKYSYYPSLAAAHSLVYRKQLNIMVHELKISIEVARIAGQKKKIYKTKDEF